jgi:7-cyano-7-deazaguanine synthase
VLLSAGLDSALNLAKACQTGQVKLALTFDYGQNAAQKEVHFSRLLAEHYQVRHSVVHLTFLAELKGSALTGSGEVPQTVINRLDAPDESRARAQAVWVPNRNGIFVNVAASFAEVLGADSVVAGFNREEAATFPDNSTDFVKAINQALSFSTRSSVKLVSFTQNMDKFEILSEAQKVGLPFQYIWSCYLGGEKMCARCESCLRMIRAVRKVGIWSEIKTRFEDAPDLPG